MGFRPELIDDLAVDPAERFRIDEHCVDETEHQVPARDSGRDRRIPKSVDLDVVFECGRARTEHGDVAQRSVEALVVDRRP